MRLGSTAPCARGHFSSASPGTVHVAASKSISSQVAPSTSPTRPTVKIRERKSLGRDAFAAAQLGHERRHFGIGDGGVVDDARHLRRHRQDVLEPSP